jgi:hypothetical protein
MGKPKRAHESIHCDQHYRRHYGRVSAGYPLGVGGAACCHDLDDPRVDLVVSARKSR